MELGEEHLGMVVPGSKLLFHATSTDGVNWVRPLLESSTSGTAQRTPVWRLPPGSGPRHVGVRDGEEAEPKRRYRALFSESGRDRWPAVSPMAFTGPFRRVPPIPSRDTQCSRRRDQRGVRAAGELPTGWVASSRRDQQGLWPTYRSQAWSCMRTKSTGRTRPSGAGRS